MNFLFIFFGILCLVSFTRIHSNYDEPAFWIEQAVRIVFGILWGLLVTQVFLAPVTFPIWFLYWGIPIVIANVIDALASFDYDDSILGIINTIIAFVVAIIYIVVITIVPASTTKAKYEFADAYVEILDSNVPETSTDNIGLVSEKTAKRLANPKIAEFKNSSKFTLGTYTKQSVNGEVVWVTPVEYGTIFRANGSTPGYLVIDAFDTSAEITNVDGNKFYYMPSAFWSKDLMRHVHNELPTKVLYDAMFQVDDNGTAFWVIPYGHYKHFAYTPVIDGIAIVNPTHGGIECYEMDEIPEWVDSVIPGSLAEKYGKWYGENKNGWWAKNFAHTDEFTLTTWAGDDAWSIVYDENGTMWYATDTTTMNSDKSMIGYMMINARTCEIKYYPNVSGLNGSGVSQNFTQLYKEKSGWTPVEPTLYNVYGTLTWFSTMVDENGSIQAYCLGDTKGNVIGETTMQAALSSYKRLLATSNIDIENPTENNDMKTVEGTVKRVIISDGCTKILLDTNQVFVVEESVSIMAQFTQPGDAVKISYLDTQEDEFYVVEFKNITLE